MFKSLGFIENTVNTSLGEMVYYSSDSVFWQSLQNLSKSESLGETKPNLVFLHGFGGGSSAYEWSQVYPAFAGEYHIIAPDLIGWGKSAHPQKNYTIDDYITTITEFLEQVCQEPTTVIASSLTAAFLVQLAIAHSHLFKQLILFTPAGLSDFEENYTKSLFAQIISTPMVDKFFYSLGVASESGIKSFLEKRQFANPQRIFPELVASYLKSASQPNAEYAALSFVRGDLCFDLSQYIQKLTIPTAIIWGRESQFTSPEIGKRLAQMNPDAVKYFQVIEEVGLTPHLELPAVAISLIRKYIQLL
ncbi:alpha/beta hydrolase [Cyanobacterium stanieri LEGE 03274]|uniref:Alpha/beta hydrolase n=1 Tax=Cyanobacterium stanieri LEGE 03274 TaxID=1828756 RepID=A0ABR9V612_9CHRO|nr:alpha/beta hydrolase [Cyanobacterium stanieri]MBE9222274.1 alpha/beta hydrolase [Cyanobacterium stanieri LEGE 03274]